MRCEPFTIMWGKQNKKVYIYIMKSGMCPYDSSTLYIYLKKTYYISILFAMWGKTWKHMEKRIINPCVEDAVKKNTHLGLGMVTIPPIYIHLSG
jgi:hypothetical protein